MQNPQLRDGTPSQSICPGLLPGSATACVRALPWRCNNPLRQMPGRRVLRPRLPARALADAQSRLRADCHTSLSHGVRGAADLHAAASAFLAGRLRNLRRHHDAAVRPLLRCVLLLDLVPGKIGAVYGPKRVHRCRFARCHALLAPDWFAGCSATTIPSTGPSICRTATIEEAIQVIVSDIRRWCGYRSPVWDAVLELDVLSLRAWAMEAAADMDVDVAMLGARFQALTVLDDVEGLSAALAAATREDVDGAIPTMCA